MTKVIECAVTDRVPILTYHSIADDPHPYIRTFSVRPSAFDHHLDLIESAGMTPLTVSQFASMRLEGCLPARPVLITFDDGWRDVASVALPMLQRRGMPATLYVTTGFLRGRSGASRIGAPATAAMHWDDLAHLADGGFEVGAHTVSHPELDIVRRRHANDEISSSRAALEDHLGHEVASFAYPHGYHDKVVSAMVAAAGFTSACVVKNAFATRTEDPMSLPRILVRSDTSPETMASWLKGEGAPVAQQHEQIRTRLWRRYRRTRAIFPPPTRTYRANTP